MASLKADSPEGSRPLSAAAPSEEGPALTLCESLKWLSAGLAVIYGGFTAYNLRQLDTPGVAQVLVFDVLTIVACVPVFVLLRRRALPLRQAEGIAIGIISLVVGNTVLSALALRTTTELAYLPFVLIASGATLFHVRWILAAFGVTLAGSAYVFYALADGDVVFTVATQAACAVAAAVLVLARQRSQQKIHALRREERQRAKELEHALARLEQELAERERAEQERQVLEEQLRQSQKLESLGVLAGGVAHDMNNVLGAISALASAALDEIEEGHAIRPDLEQILIAASRGGALTHNLLGFARKGQQLRERVNLNETVDEVVRLLERAIPKRITVERELEPHLDDVIGDPGQLGQLLVNLCHNAVEAIGESAGKLTLRTARLKLDAPLDGVAPGPYVSVSVTDNGAGMEADVAARAFEPFFTTKDSLSHPGLGLSMVYGTACQHNGRVRIASAPGSGTTVTLDLPATPVQQVAQDTGSRLALMNEDRPRTVLLVDDDPLLRAAGRRLLKQLGMKSLDASDGREALELYREHQPEISLVILDVAMPVMDGVECFWELKKLDSSVRVLLSSGFPKGNDLDELFAAGAVGYLAKPYEKAPFARAISSALAG